MHNNQIIHNHRKPSNHRDREPSGPHDNDGANPRGGISDCLNGGNNPVQPIAIDGFT